MMKQKKRQVICIEYPQSLIKSSTVISGANIISQYILKQWLVQTEYQCIFVTDASDVECQEMQAKLVKNNHVFCNYQRLIDVINHFQWIPDVAFITDLNAERMMQFRNLNHFSFPVIGLIHSLGTPSALKQCREIMALNRSNDGLICPSEATQKTLVKYGYPKRQTTVIPFACDFNKFKPSKDRQSLRRQYGLPSEKVVCLIYGRITASFKMDITPVLRLMEQNRKKWSSLLLYIVGVSVDDEYIRELSKLIKQWEIDAHVKWCLEPKQDQVETYFQCSDIFLSLSDSAGETFGLTVMEAMASELPVVISDFSGYRQHIQSNDEGCLIPTFGGNISYEKSFYYHDLKDFGDKYAQSIAVDNKRLELTLTQLIEDKHKRTKMGSLARKAVQKRNQPKAITAQIQQFFNQCIQTPSQPQELTVTRQSIAELLSHFTTRGLQQQDKFKLNPVFQKKYQSNEPIYIFERHLQRYHLIKDVLHSLNQKSVTMKALKEQVSDQEDALEMTLLYLLKHGFIDIVG